MRTVNLPTGPEDQIECAYDEQKHTDYNDGSNDKIRNTAFHYVGDDRIHKKYLEPLPCLTALKGDRQTLDHVLEPCIL